ncbi:uncharacterized protein P884DRAFT_213091 [Thermothelomyces heterothallicus CBS 202.75]|uniref:uncharacterized protein n=1 Tax=Thermothelomyces heterothallicus CBS 202.75 TaxID=1149848 RepID=UPI003743E482
MDEFSDDGFDDLNDTILQELEDKAIQITQAQKLTQTQAAPQPQHNALEYEFEDDDLDDTVVIDEHAQLAPRPPPQQAHPVQQPRHPAGITGTQRWNQHLPPSRPSYPPRPQYGPTARAAPQPLSSQRYQPGPSQRFPSLPGRPQQPPPQSQFARPPPPVPRPSPYAPQTSQVRTGAGPANQNEVIAALQARLSELESDLTAAKGEASILRSKYDKARATHEADIARLKKETAEQLARQERIIEQARNAERATATELQFARQDLREGLGRAKSRRRDGPATPRKDRTWGTADGFDGVEILSSPSKTQALRRKDSGPAAVPASERTPTKGKRKRPIVDSPKFALEIEDAREAVFDDARSVNARSLSLAAASQPFSPDFLKLFLNHTTMHGQPPTFDMFSRFCFPSDPERSLASIVLQKLPQMGNPGDPTSLLVDFADTLIDLWHQCLSERYYGPIYHLVSLLLYTLDLNAVEVAPHILSSLIPVCATTCRLVALPRLNSADGDLSGHPDAVVRQLCLNIDVTQCLSVLYLAASGCFPQPLQNPTTSDQPQDTPQLEFWKTIELDFVLTMLSPKNPEEDWSAMMILLRTSVAPNSIGPIPSSATNSTNRRSEAKTADAVAATLIDCVSSFLCEPPKWATPRSAKEIPARLAALRTLMAFATGHFGARQIAESDVAIPRLVTVLCWALDRLYDSDLPLSPEPQAGAWRPPDERGDSMELDHPNAESAGSMEARGTSEGLTDVSAEVTDPAPDSMSLLHQIIAQGTRLLHFLVTDHRTSDAANISTKLAASHGGSQRYFLTLARLNFAEEDLVLEAGIDAETVELAHELLELAVTPDEGDEISEMFD